MKKTVLHVLALMFCVTISHYSYSQKKKSTTIDSFYYEVPNSQNQFFKGNTWVSGDSLPVSGYSYYTNTLFNSERTDFSLNRTIKLDDHSGEQIIPVEISDTTSEFLLTINCGVQSGLLTVEIYDPTGAKKGNFSVKGDYSSSSSWSEDVGSVINKRFMRPLKGTWSLKFIAKKVSADIHISTTIK